MRCDELLESLPGDGLPLTQSAEEVVSGTPRLLGVVPWQFRSRLFGLPARGGEVTPLSLARLWGLRVPSSFRVMKVLRRQALFQQSALLFPRGCDLYLLRDQLLENFLARRAGVRHDSSRRPRSRRTVCKSSSIEKNC